MEQRMVGLEESKMERKLKREQKGMAAPWRSLPQLPPNIRPHDLHKAPLPVFSENPFEDLFPNSPQQPLRVTGREGGFVAEANHAWQVLQFQNQAPSRHIDDGDDQVGSPSKVVPQSDAEIPVGGRISATTYISTSSLKARLSQYSSIHVKTIARLIKVHSISNSSAATTTGHGLACPHSLNEEYASVFGDGTVGQEANAYGTQKATLILPSSILMLDEHLQKQGLCITGMKTHDSKQCWCLKDYPLRHRWVFPDGFVWPLRHGPPAFKDSYFHLRDAFGNSILHVLAARGADWDLIIEALEKGVNGNVKNTAGQNFLHVLAPGTVTQLAEDPASLMTLIRNLNRFDIRYHDHDLFGQNFYHMLIRALKKVTQTLFWMQFSTLGFLNAQPRPSRDAFGLMSTFCRSYQTDLHTEVSHLSELEAHECPRVDSAVLASPASQSAEPSWYHAGIMKTARLAIEDPDIEDKQGRNGLHCLARALLPMNCNQKRKRKPANKEDSSTGLSLLYELVHKLLKRGVDANHYDKNGDTVLIAFVKYRHDGEDDKTLARLFRYLITNPHSMAIITRRNRQGETALHIAVRLGRKIATRVLLENGANVHARTNDGKGVMAMGEVSYFRARSDPTLYASIMACMALVVKYGAVATPTLVREWTLTSKEFASLEEEWDLVSTRFI